MIDAPWLKLMSGAAAMPEVTGVFFTRDYSDVASNVFTDIERTRRILGGFNPILDASRQMRALDIAALPAFQEAVLAQERITQLMQPLGLTSLTRDLAGLSDAITSVASMIRLPPTSLERDVAAIASSALGSWRSYVDAMPTALDSGDLFGAQAAGRSVLGVTASSAILLGDEDAVAVAQEWELAPVEGRERMRDGLARISGELVIRLDGAWDAVAHAGPDSASQAANSAIELIDWTLRLACEQDDDPGIDAWILDQAKPSQYRDQRGQPTRPAKIKYLLRESPFESEFVEATVRQLGAMQRELQKMKHKHGAESVDAVARLLPSVEAVLFLILE